LGAAHKRIVWRPDCNFLVGRRFKAKSKNRAQDTQKCQDWKKRSERTEVGFEERNRTPVR